jgi:large subunit ribosomal protein L17
MRHRRLGRELDRTAEHRKMLLRNLVTELFRHERIETTTAKAKEARRLAERLITFAKRGDIHARRQVDRYVMSRDVTRKLFSTIAPWYAERPGGYTRIIRTRHRLGDGGEMAFLELVKSEEQMAADRKKREAAAEAKAKKKEARAKAMESEAEAAAPAEEEEEKPKAKKGRGKQKGEGEEASAQAAPKKEAKGRKSKDAAPAAKPKKGRQKKG